MSAAYLGLEGISFDDSINMILDGWLFKRSEDSKAQFEKLSSEAQERVLDTARKSIVRFLRLNLMSEEERVKEFI